MVRQLLDRRLSRRKIEQIASVSRATIRRIARMDRPHYQAACREQPEGDRDSQLAGQPTRCSVCGYRVFLPCRICMARQHRQVAGHYRRLSAVADQAPTLRLKPEHRARYEEVRKGVTSTGGAAVRPPSRRARLSPIKPIDSTALLAQHECEGAGTHAPA